MQSIRYYLAADADGAGTGRLDNQLAARQRRPSTPVETIRRAGEGSAPVREPDDGSGGVLAPYEGRVASVPTDGGSG